MKDIRRIQGPGPVTPARPVDRDVHDEQDEARAFQRTLRREYLDHHRASPAQPSPAKDVAVGFDERVIVSGTRAPEALAQLERLVVQSPTFRSVVEKSFADRDTLWIVIGRGGGYSRATIGAKDEKVYINLDQGDLLDLLIHECGHALAKLDDGPLGGFGPNQRFQAVVKREMDMARGGIAAYGEEVRPEPPGRVRGR